MENLLVLLISTIFAFVLGILSFVLKKKHSQFPDFRAGYHNKKIMVNKEKWEDANNLAGNLCALFAIIDMIVFAILYFVKLNIGITIIVFFIYSITTILVILIVPVHLSKN